MKWAYRSSQPLRDSVDSYASEQSTGKKQRERREKQSRNTSIATYIRNRRPYSRILPGANHEDSPTTEASGCSSDNTLMKH